MKIPRKLTEAQFKKLMKKHKKYVESQIENSVGDLNMLLELLHDLPEYDPATSVHDEIDTYQELIKYWASEMKAEFRQFMTARRQMVAALNRNK